MAKRYNKQDLAAWITDQLHRSYTATKEWREETERCYQYYSGHQWDEEDLAVLHEERRPAIVFNRVSATIDAIYGTELTNRMDTTYIPVEHSLEQPDSTKAELMNNAARYFNAKANAQFHKSRAFQDLCICGLGATVQYVDFERDAEGEYKQERIDPLLNFWDPTASGPNGEDTRWRAVVKLVARDDLVAIWGKKAQDAIDQGEVPQWLYGDGEGTPHDADNAWRYNPGPEGSGHVDMTDVQPLVEFQWFEIEKRHRAWLPVINPQTGQQQIVKRDLTSAQLNELNESEDVPEFKTVQYGKRVYKRAFLVGSTVMEVDDNPYDNGFTIQYMTGKYDKRLRAWSGVMRNMIGPLEADGPQQMANKIYSEITHIMSTNSRGGLLAESDAFVNQMQAEERWASSDSIVWMRPGGLNKVKEKDMANYPVGLDKLMTWAVSAIPEVTGVSWEMLGLANREQPNVLETNRKNSTVTVLAWLFDALRLYNIETGRVLMYFIQEIFAGDTPEDSALIRVDAANAQQVVPLLKDGIANKYDIIVDEAASSPNMKEQVWGVLTTLMPHFQQMGMPVPPEAFDYLPIPVALANKWKQMAMPNPQVQQAQQEQQQLQKEAMQAEVAVTKADAQLKLAKAGEAAVGAQAEQLKTQAEVANIATQIMGGGMFNQMPPGENESENEGDK